MGFLSMLTILMFLIVVTSSGWMLWDSRLWKQSRWDLPEPLQWKAEALRAEETARMYEARAQDDPRWADIARAYRNRSNELGRKWLS
jgi:hypothetical protein